jgi:hypothetical protein
MSTAQLATSTNWVVDWIQGFFFEKNNVELIKDSLFDPHQVET